MGEFRFSRLAEADLLDIGGYTLRTWGEDQAIQYINDLETCCRRLADNPQLGRACYQIRAGLRRMEMRGTCLVLSRRSRRGKRALARGLTKKCSTD